MPKRACLMSSHAALLPGCLVAEGCGPGVCRAGAAVVGLGAQPGHGGGRRRGRARRARHQDDRGGKERDGTTDHRCSREGDPPPPPPREGGMRGQPVSPTRAPPSLCPCLVWVQDPSLAGELSALQEHGDKAAFRRLQQAFADKHLAGQAGPATHTRTHFRRQRAEADTLDWSDGTSRLQQLRSCSPVCRVLSCVLTAASWSSSEGVDVSALYDNTFVDQSRQALKNDQVRDTCRHWQTKGAAWMRADDLVGAAVCIIMPMLLVFQIMRRVIGEDSVLRILDNPDVRLLDPTSEAAAKAGRRLQAATMASS